MNSSRRSDITIDSRRVFECVAGRKHAADLEWGEQDEFIQGLLVSWLPELGEKHMSFGHKENCS